MPISKSTPNLTEEEKPPAVSSMLMPFYPNWIKETPPSPLKNFYTKNGHLKLIKNLKVEIVSQLDRARKLWNDFSPKQNLFDTWEFRQAFYNAYKYPLYFIVFKIGNEIVAMLPLWYENDEKRYVFFGSIWQEENSFFVKDPILTPLLLSIAPSPIYLNALTQQTIQSTSNFADFSNDDPKFILDLTNLKNVDDFLATLKKKRRYNLRRDFKKIESQKPEIIVDDFSHIDELIKLSIKRFAEKGEDTDWEDPRRIEAFRQVIALGKKGESFKVRMITVKISGAVASVDLIAIYNGCYYPLKCGYDVAEFPGIGNFVNLYEIKDAIDLGMKKMDFLEIDYGWKNKWFAQVPLFRYTKNYDADELPQG